MQYRTMLVICFYRVYRWGRSTLLLCGIGWNVTTFWWYIHGPQNMNPADFRCFYILNTYKTISISTSVSWGVGCVLALTLTCITDNLNMGNCTHTYNYTLLIVLLFKDHPDVFLWKTIDLPPELDHISWGGIDAVCKCIYVCMYVYILFSLKVSKHVITQTPNQQKYSQFLTDWCDVLRL